MCRTQYQLCEMWSVFVPVVVRELEEKLLMAVKEKENLEDLLQERQSEVSLISQLPTDPLLSVTHNSSNEIHYYQLPTIP